MPYIIRVLSFVEAMPPGCQYPGGKVYIDSPAKAQPRLTTGLRRHGLPAAYTPIEIHVDGKVAGWCADVAGDGQPVISPTPVPDIVGILTSLYIGVFSPKCPQPPGRPGDLFLPAWSDPYQNVVIFA